MKKCVPSWHNVHDIQHKLLYVVGGFFERPAKIPDTRITYARVGMVRHTKALKGERLPFGNVESLGTRILKHVYNTFTQLFT